MLVTIFTLSTCLAQAADCTSLSGTDASPASYNSNGTWNCGNVPTSSDNVIINHVVSSAGSLVFNSGTRTITINAGGELRITGDLSLATAGIELIINGILTVSGAITVADGAKITMNSGSINAQSLTVSGSGPVNIHSGDVTIQNALSINDSGTVNFNSSGTLGAGSFASPSGSGKTLNINSGTLLISGNTGIAFGTTINIDDDAAFETSTLTLEDASSAILNNEGETTVSGDVMLGGQINNLSTGTFDIDGDLLGQATGNAEFHNYGDLTVTGNASFPDNATFNVYPGGLGIVEGNFSFDDAVALTIGTAVAPPPYADMVIHGNLTSTESGKAVIEENGRLAVFGDLWTTGGGSMITINAGGQVYVDGDGAGSSVSMADFSASSIVNLNSDVIYNGSPTPYGFYVNGSINNTGNVISASADQDELEGSNPDFFNWVVSHSTGSFSSLPIELLFFDATVANTIKLKWATSMEYNFDEFIIQRASKGEFTEIGRIKGSGFSTSRKDYYFEDRSPISGRSYYRLSAVDYDGQTQSFNIIAIQYDGLKSIDVYPSPVASDSFVVFESTFRTSAHDEVHVYNLNGQLVYVGKVGQSLHKFSLPVTFNAGQYILRYKSTTFDVTLKFLVD